MLDQPGYEIVAAPAATDRVHAPDGYRERVCRTLARVRESVGAPAAEPVSLELQKVIPRHMGLGSGTQLALAVAQSVLGASVTPALELAEHAGRGARSAVGVHGFESGGFLVDAGKRSAETLGTVAVRVGFPSEWRILLWMPDGRRGLSGEQERKAFATMPAMRPALSDRLCALVLREMLPALNERDFGGFSRGLRSYGDMVGDFFAPVQGGPWTDPQGSAVADWLSERGLEGFAQSSWGPAVAAFAPDADTAEELIRDWPFDAGRTLVARARNCGAVVVTRPSPPVASKPVCP